MNQRLIVDVPSEHPNVWQVSKVERVNVRGRTRIGLYQTEFDPHRDYIEKDENGNIIGMWADYYSSTVNPNEVENIIDEEIFTPSCSLTSTDNIIKIGGGYKTISASILNTSVDTRKENWHAYIDGMDVTSTLVKFLEYSNGIKVKFIGDKTYLKKVLRVTLESGGSVDASIDFEIKAL